MGPLLVPKLSPDLLQLLAPPVAGLLSRGAEASMEVAVEMDLMSAVDYSALVLQALRLEQLDVAVEVLVVVCAAALELDVAAAH